MIDVLNAAGELNGYQCTIRVSRYAGTLDKSGRCKRQMRPAEREHSDYQANAKYGHELSVPVRIADPVESALLVTGSRAISILADRLITIIRPFVLTGPVVTGVATGAVRLERRVLPGDRLGIRLVTLCACLAAAMVQRLVGKRRVPELVWRPCVAVVAGVALLLRIKVPLVVSGRSHAVMTRGTGAKNLIVIDIEYRYPRCRRVAVLADIRR